MKPPTRSARRHSSWVGQFLPLMGLTVIAAICAALVVLAFNRPAPSPTQSTFRPTTISPSVSPTPAVTMTATPTVAAFLGDSYTVGAGASRESARWPAAVSQSMGWLELNFGQVGTGYGTASSGEPNDFRSRVSTAVAADPEIVIVSGGAFDYTGSEDPSSVSEAITDTFTSLRAGLPEAEILAVSPIWGSADVPDRLVEIAEEIKLAVQTVGGSYVDIGQPLAVDPAQLMREGLPTDAGYAVLSAAIADAMLPLVESRAPE